MPKTYEGIRLKVQDLTAQSKWASATTDIWTNASKTCSLLSFTGHFIVSDRRLKVILGACVLEQDHSSQYIEQKFTDMVNKWGLQGKIFLVLRDNAANMVRAMRDQYESIGCIAHMLQLVIKQALLSEEEIKDLLKKCSTKFQYLKVYDEPVAKAIPVPLHKLVPVEDDSLMKPIEPEVIDLLYGSTEKGATEKYLKMRYKKAPKDKFYLRLTSNWDYGWQQKQSHIKARDINRGRCAVLRDTFYRKNNLAPDPRHYSSPAGGEFSICSEYSCSAN